MPHTHYGPVMGVVPHSYNTRSKKRARHGESYTVGILTDYTHHLKVCMSTWDHTRQDLMKVCLCSIMHPLAESI